MGAADTGSPGGAEPRVPDFSASAGGGAAGVDSRILVREGAGSPDNLVWGGGGGGRSWVLEPRGAPGLGRWLGSGSQLPVNTHPGRQPAQPLGVLALHPRGTPGWRFQLLACIWPSSTSCGGHSGREPGDGKRLSVSAFRINKNKIYKNSNYLLENWRANRCLESLPLACMSFCCVRVQAFFQHESYGLQQGSPWTALWDRAGSEQTGIPKSWS